MVIKVKGCGHVEQIPCILSKGARIRASAYVYSVLQSAKLLCDDNSTSVEIDERVLV